MSLQVEKLEKNMAKLTIEVSAEDLEKAMQAAYQKAKGRITLPGFRKGKAPRKMIEQMYGKGIFLEDAANALIPEHYSKAQDHTQQVLCCNAQGSERLQRPQGILPFRTSARSFFLELFLYGIPE